MSEVLEKPQRIVDLSQRLWYIQEGENTKIGFTPEFLEIVNDCWHVTPASKTKIKKGSPLVTVETNDAQFSVLSPVDGDLLRFNDAAMNFPDKITEDDVIFLLGVREKPNVKEARPIAEFDIGRMQAQWVAENPVATPSRQIQEAAARRAHAELFDWTITPESPR